MTSSAPISGRVALRVLPSKSVVIPASGVPALATATEFEARCRSVEERNGTAVLAASDALSFVPPADSVLE